MCLCTDKQAACWKERHTAESRLQPINGYFSIFLLDVALVISLQIRFFKAVHKMEITNVLQQWEIAVVLYLLTSNSGVQAVSSLRWINYPFSSHLSCAVQQRSFYLFWKISLLNFNKCRTEFEHFGIPEPVDFCLHLRMFILPSCRAFSHLGLSQIAVKT